MEKVKIELTDKEFSAISTLLATFCCNKYQKAFGGKVVTESSVMVSNDVAKTLQDLSFKFCRRLFRNL